MDTSAIRRLSRSPFLLQTIFIPSRTLLSIPKYDFGWQTDYWLAQPLSLPKGSKLHVTAHFDNSPANRFNPDAKTVVRWGDQTWEEMMIGYITYTVDNARVSTIAQR